MISKMFIARKDCSKEKGNQFISGEKEHSRVKAHITQNESAKKCKFCNTKRRTNELIIH